MDDMTAWDELRQAMAMAVEIEARAARMAERQDEQERRTTDLERAVEQRIRGLEATVAEQNEVLVLAGRTMKVVQDVCARHGYDPEQGLSVVEWLDHVLEWSATGWPSVN